VTRLPRLLVAAALVSGLCVQGAPAMLAGQFIFRIPATPADGETFYTLEITNIGPVADGRTTANRIYWAYPGIDYNIRAAVVGGAFPFTYSLSNAPSGMSIDADTGEITWTNPTTDATDIVLTVTDADAAQDTATWSIDVDSTRFKFIDAVNGDNASNNGCGAGCGDGSVSAPWLDMLDLVLNDAATDLIYFRTGTYAPTDASGHASAIGGGGGEQAIAITTAVHASRTGSVVWLEYPGESAIIDFGGDQTTLVDAWGVRMTGADIYVDGFEAMNASCLGFQFEANGGFRGATVRRVAFHDLGPGQNGLNCAFVDTRASAPSASYGMVIQDVSFDDMNQGGVYDAAVPIKLYSQYKTLIEDITMTDCLGGAHLKQDVRQFTVRSSDLRCDNITLGGNMDDCNDASCEGQTETSYGEIIYNFLKAPLTDPSNIFALDLNQSAQQGESYVYRNTIDGFVRIRNSSDSSQGGGSNADGSNGPFNFERNVIINSGGSGGVCVGYQLRCETTGSYPVFNYAGIVTSEQLLGAAADNIIDSNGLLLGSYRTTYLGTRGWEIP
jgi:hypothetical protein